MGNRIGGPDGLAPLLELLSGRRAIVLAGAGCSTESGIPDYRGPDAPAPPRQPIMYQAFVGSSAARARYWTRSSIGWQRIRAARPNPAHHALARLEADGTVCGLITQNVDGLHRAAGSRNVVELHGSLAAVRCLECSEVVDRDAFQHRILTHNPAWSDALKHRPSGAAQSAPSAPDGDVELGESAFADFVVPGCAECDGTMKPDVVFFGENVPSERVQQAWNLFERGDVLLVVGSSLTVFSGRRFVYRAQKEGMPVAVVNIGPTRADDIATVRVEGRLGDVLPRLVESLTTRRPTLPLHG